MVQLFSWHFPERVKAHLRDLGIIKYVYVFNLCEVCPDSGPQELRCLWDFRDYLQRGIFFLNNFVIEMWHKSFKMVILPSKLILQEVFFYVSEKAVCNQKTLQNTCWF